MKLVLCNCPVDSAPTIAKALVHQRLAACVNVLPAVESVYRWDGEVVTDTEKTLLIKTASERVSDLRIRLLELHPYDVPEIVVIDVDVSGSHGPYMRWVVDETLNC